MPRLPEEKTRDADAVTELRTLVVPTDFSEISNRALDYANVLAAKFAAKVIVVHVEENGLSSLMAEYTSVDELRQVVDMRKQQSRARLAQVAERHLPKGLEVDLCVAEGVPHVEIARLAAQKEADVIVMATHGRGFVSHLLLGSTTEQVIRRSACPVFVVRGRHS